MAIRGVTGDKLVPLVECWPKVRELLGTKGFETICFVENAFTELQMTLYINTEDTGLWVPVSEPGPLLSDLGTSNYADRFANGVGGIGPDVGWLDWRVTHADYKKLIALAEYIANIMPGQMECDSINYPPELSAAVEAFNAVHAVNIGGRSPKAALKVWLKENRPELSANARDRIATVANWQPSGGAPKTPG